jgi:hypothetical protein
MRYYCNICKNDISEKVYFYSKNRFGRALCREHQRLERIALERSSQVEQQGSMVEQETVKTEEIVDADEVSVNDEVPKSGWKTVSKVAMKMGRGVIK